MDWNEHCRTEARRILRNTVRNYLDAIQELERKASQTLTRLSKSYDKEIHLGTEKLLLLESFLSFSIVEEPGEQVEETEVARIDKDEETEKFIAEFEELIEMIAENVKSKLTSISSSLIIKELSDEQKEEY